MCATSGLFELTWTTYPSSRPLRAAYHLPSFSLILDEEIFCQLRGINTVSLKPVP